MSCEVFEFEKRSGERETLSVKFSKRIPITTPATTISSYGADTVTAYGANGLSVDQNETTLIDKEVFFTVDGGTSGNDYYVEVWVRLSDTQKKEALFKISVVDCEL